MPSAIDSALGTAQLVAAFSGVPVASGVVMLLQSINNTCSQVAVHKVTSLLVYDDLQSLMHLCCAVCTRVLRQSLRNLRKDVRPY